jgi:hypothetical protein
MYKLRPVLESILAGQDELSIGQGHVGGLGWIVQTRNYSAQTLCGGRGAGAVISQ